MTCNSEISGHARKYRSVFFLPEIFSHTLPFLTAMTLYAIYDKETLFAL